MGSEGVTEVVSSDKLSVGNVDVILGGLHR